MQVETIDRCGVNNIWRADGAQHGTASCFLLCWQGATGRDMSRLAMLISLSILESFDGVFRVYVAANGA